MKLSVICVALLAFTAEQLRAAMAPVPNLANIERYRNGQKIAPVVLAPSPSVAPGVKTSSSASASQTTTSIAAAATHAPLSYDKNGFPVPDPTYNTTSSGPVTILMLYDQVNSIHGQYITKSARSFTSTPLNNNGNLKIEIKPFPQGNDYHTYLDQVRSACDQKITNLFDVVMLEATVLGELADCLVDLSAWDPKMADGFAPAILANSYVDKRLVSLPTEADFGVLYFNADVMAKYTTEGAPTNFDELETKATAVIKALRAGDNYAFSGYTGQFTDDYFTAQITEWMYGCNNSVIINPTTGQVAIETTAVARVINRVSTWTANNIIDPNDFQLPATPLFLTPSQMDSLLDTDPSLQKFVDGKALFLRHWSSTFQLLLKTQVDFGWGVAPVIGWNNGVNVGTLGGWGVGVYKYSDNPAGAVKVASWLASTSMQRGAIVSGGVKFAPTRSDLYNDATVCGTIGPDLCDIYKTITPAVRPSSLVGHHYRNVSKIISDEMTTFFLTPETIVEALTNVGIALAKELNQTRSNSTIDIDPPAPGKKIPSHVQVQLLGLCAVILITCSAVYMVKRRQIDDKIKDAGDKLKVLAQTAKQEVIMKTTARRADLDFGVNEFSHLDEEMDVDDKKLGLAQKGANPGYVGVDDAEKDDFI
ncbi:UNVERIFIED_CONTAM: hypothetical protein HDU68_007657 [Siphonaria sp. JEL0065]|nr:hypothetical protein HDU68_007657 [Siphonaria sp. JEL0065]